MSSTALARKPDDKLATVNDTASITALVARKHLLAQAMKEVLTEGVHYGKIPGCGDKPSLYKSGAEVLATLFGLAPSFDVVERELTGGHREYRVTCHMRHIASGADLGEGIGICSTMESKYRWRGGERKCPSCDVPALFKSKKEPEWFCWSKKGGCGATFALDDEEVTSQAIGRMENPDIADVYNTVIKMAQKRAQVAATLTTCGASDVLTQDLEDMAPEDVRERHDGRERAGADYAAAARTMRQAEKPTEKPADATDDLVERERLSQELLASIATMVTDDDFDRVAARAKAVLKQGTRAYDAVLRAFKERVSRVTAQRRTPAEDAEYAQA